MPTQTDIRELIEVYHWSPDKIEQLLFAETKDQLAPDGADEATRRWAERHAHSIVNKLMKRAQSSRWWARLMGGQ